MPPKFNKYELATRPVSPRSNVQPSVVQPAVVQPQVVQPQEDYYQLLSQPEPQPSIYIPPQDDYYRLLSQPEPQPTIYIQPSSQLPNVSLSIQVNSIPEAEQTRILNLLMPQLREVMLSKSVHLPASVIEREQGVNQAFAFMAVLRFFMQNLGTAVDNIKYLQKMYPDLYNNLKVYDKEFNKIKSDLQSL